MKRFTFCACDAAGFCKRHGVHKSAHWRHLCQTDDALFRLWESGCGPDQAGWIGSVSSTIALPARWISTAQLVQDSLELASMLPPDITHIAAIPRSGLICGATIACHLHLPLVMVQQGRLVTCGHGSRISADDLPASGSRIAFVDDTQATGMERLRLRAHQLLKPPHVFAVVYAPPNGEVDYCVRRVELPHLLEWNLFNSEYVSKIGTDMDGILCHDPPHQSRSLYLCRRTPVRAIVTARPARERAVTLAWLKTHRVKYEQLRMWPHEPESNRDLSRVATWKTHMVREAGLQWYVESEPTVADAMRQLGVRVLCPSQGELR